MVALALFLNILLLILSELGVCVYVVTRKMLNRLLSLVYGERFGLVLADGLPVSWYSSIWL